MSHIELFVQFEGTPRVELARFPEDIDAAGVRAWAVALGLAYLAEALIFADEVEEALEEDRPLRDQGIGHKHRIHLHRCPEIRVTLHFVDETRHHVFRPAATVKRVKKWFVDAINMSAVDATEHVLQITGTNERPNPDLHIGSLVSERCALELSLVPIKRIEG